MRISSMLVPTLKEDPAEAEVVSHKLLLRAGMIRKVAGGIYNYLPLGWRVLNKVTNIVRQEMDRAGSQEILMPIIQPAELWLESGRWNVYGKELFRIKDRHDRDFCLGPTHEEVVTDLVRREVSSYKQLPLLLYQIQNKYRDERRPRFGLMRGREFLMKDLYSFDKDMESSNISYQKMYDAYSRILERCGLKYRAVEADAGAIGGSTTHEFMVLANSGEGEIVYCEKCNYAANVEKATAKIKAVGKEELASLELIATPDVKTIDDLTNYLNISADKAIKTLIYQADDILVGVCLRGDREVNEIKLQNILNCNELALASDEAIIKKTGSKPGYIGPLRDLALKLLVDEEVLHIYNGVCGANQENYHYKNVNPQRDFQTFEIVDIRNIKAGDLCPHCNEALASTRGIEVGHIFQLGTKYSDALNATYLDENGKANPFVMGCYGIGISRTMAAAVEQNNDERGIAWPLSIAPYHVIVIPANTKDEKQMEYAENIYNKLLETGVEVVLDDRNERAGAKFADADLIGYPFRITVGKRTVNEETVDLKYRRTNEEETVNLDEIITKIKILVNE